MWTSSFHLNYCIHSLNFLDVYCIFSTRDECNKLTKIIQSRVIDVQSAENDQHCVPKELPNMAAREAFACPQACQSLHQSGDIPKTIRSPSILNCHSPGPSASPAVKFNFHDSVVIEARKGLELKRTPSCLKASLDHGLCTLNTDVLHYVSVIFLGFLHYHASYLSLYITGSWPTT